MASGRRVCMVHARDQFHFHSSLFLILSETQVRQIG